VIFLLLILRPTSKIIPVCSYKVFVFLLHCRAIPDITLFTEDVAFNICGMQEGKYTLCAKEELSPSPNPSPISLTSSELASSSIIPSYVGDDAFVSSNDDVAGFALWVIALIVIVALLSVCCAGYAVAVVYCGVSNCLDFTKIEDTNTVKSSFFYDERTIGGTHQRLKNLTIENSSNWDKGRSQKTSARRILSLGENGREMPRIEDGSHFHHNAGSLALTTITLGTRAQRRAGRDPTTYIPGQEEKPDPDGTLTILQVHNDSRNLALAEVKIIQNENREIQPFMTAELHKIKALAVKYLQNEYREIQPFTRAEEPKIEALAVRILQNKNQEILPFTTAEDPRQLQMINTMINVVNQVDTIGGN